MDNKNEIIMSDGVKCGAVFGILLGIFVGFMGPVWSSFEMGKSAGEIITWYKVTDAMQECKSMSGAIIQ